MKADAFPLRCGKCRAEIALDHDAYFLSAKATAWCLSCATPRRHALALETLNCSCCGRACPRLLSDPRWHCSTRCRQQAEARTR